MIYKKDCQIPKIILAQGFCPLKNEIAQFPIGFRLNTLYDVMTPFGLDGVDHVTLMLAE